MSQDLIPQALGQYCTRKQPSIQLDGKVQPYDYDGTNTNLLTGEELERVGRKGWCYEGDGVSSRVELNDITSSTRSVISKGSRVDLELVDVNGATLEFYLKVPSSISSQETVIAAFNSSPSTLLRFLKINGGGSKNLRLNTSTIYGGATSFFGVTNLADDQFHFIEVVANWSDKTAMTIEVKADGLQEIFHTFPDATAILDSEIGLGVTGLLSTITPDEYSTCSIYGLKLKKLDGTVAVSMSCQEESGTITYDTGIAGNHGTITGNIHSQDDDVTFSDADDRGAGIVVENILTGSSQYPLDSTVSLGTTFRIEVEFTSYFIYFAGIANSPAEVNIGLVGLQNFIVLKGSTVTVRFNNNTSFNLPLSTLSGTLFNPRTEVLQLKLTITKDGSGNGTLVGTIENLADGSFLTGSTTDLAASGNNGTFSFANLADRGDGGQANAAVKITSIKVYDEETTEGTLDYHWTPQTTASELIDGVINISSLNHTDGVIPLLEDGTTPANSNITQAQYTGQYKPYLQVVGSPCLNFTNAASNQLEFTDLTGVASVTNEGTATLTISGNNLVINSGADDGTVFGVKLWSGAGGTGTLIDELPCCENAGSIVNSVYDSANYSAAINGALTNVWDLTQNVYSFLQAKGGNISDGSGSVPLGGFIPTKLDSNGNSTFEDVQGNALDPVLCDGRAIQEFDNEINVNPEDIPAITQMGYSGVDANVPDSILGSLFGALKARSENEGYNNLTLFDTGVDNIAPCLTLDGTTNYIDLDTAYNFNVGQKLTFYSLGSVLTGTLLVLSDQADAQRNVRWTRSTNTFGLSLESATPNEFVFSSIPSNFKCEIQFISSTEGKIILTDLDTGTTEEVTNSSMITAPADSTFDRIGAANSGALNKVDGQLFGFEIRSIATNELLWAVPMSEGVGSIVNEVVNGYTGTIEGTLTTVWDEANYQTVYDYLGAYGGNEYPDPIVQTTGDDITSILSSRSLTSNVTQAKVNAEGRTDIARFTIGVDLNIIISNHDLNNIVVSPEYSTTDFTNAYKRITFDVFVPTQPDALIFFISAYYGAGKVSTGQSVSNAVGNTGAWTTLVFEDTIDGASGYERSGFSLGLIDGTGLIDTTGRIFYIDNWKEEILSTTPSQLPLNGTDVQGNNLPTEEIERVLDQQQGLSLNQKI